MAGYIYLGSAQRVSPTRPRMSLYPWRSHVALILLALYPAESLASNFTQCFESVFSCAENSTSFDCTATLNISNTTALSVLRTSKGFPVFGATDEATALSYASCVQYCGSGQEPFSWNDFSQEYSAWLLPYLALLSQLPFGARRRMDNLMSAVLTLGSPTLAGYSLYLTLLNARWVNDHLFSDINYPSTVVRRSVIRVLNSLQQVPLRVHPGDDGRFESLVVHPENDEWWIVFAEELEYSHTWSIASATNILWVVIAYLLTVAYSISNIAENINSNGQGTGSGWLWLLPVVVGWLILSPKCDHKRVLDAYDKANRRALVANPHDPTAAPTHVTSNFGVTITPTSHWEPCSNIISPDESRIPPVFNYARVWLWSQNAYVTSLFYRSAWVRSNHRIGVDDQPILGNVRNDVPRECRLGTRDQIIRYCRPDDHEYPRSSILWPRGIFYNMIVASLMALQLQWGTTSAAVLVVWFTPTIGLGCRSLAYLLYGVLSTTVWILMVLSSVLGYYAHYLLNSPPTSDVETAWTRPLSTPSPQSKMTPAGSVIDNCPEPSVVAGNCAIPLCDTRTFQGHSTNPDLGGAANIATDKRVHATRLRARTLARLADWLRWLGKTLAIANAIGTVANSLFQYAGVYDTCFCDSSVYTWGPRAFSIFAPNASDINLAWSSWIGALTLALSSCAVFVGSIYLLRDSLPK